MKEKSHAYYFMLLSLGFYQATLCIMRYRQQKLEQLAEKFNRKAALRESWLGDMNQVLDELNKGQDVHAVDAALKRHEAIGADINAGETRIQVVRDLIRELSHEKFHGVDTLSAR